MSDLENLFLAVGCIVVQWASIDGAMSIATNAIYLNAEIPNKPKQIPKFAKDMTRFMRRCAQDCKELRSVKADALTLLDETENQRELREYFVHSVLTNPVANNGVYTFTRVDAKDSNHQATDWLFDSSTFPDVEERCRLLSDRWHQMSLRVCLIYEARKL